MIVSQEEYQTVSEKKKENPEGWEQNHQINSRIPRHQNHRQTFHPLQHLNNWQMEYLFIERGKKEKERRKETKRSRPIVATSHFPPCLFSLIYWTTSKPLALSCMVELHPLKRKTFDAVSRMNTSSWFKDDLEKGTCEQAYHREYTRDIFQLDT